MHKNENGLLICNPGSISLPKGGTPAGYAIYENKKISLYDLQGNIIKSDSI